MRISSPSFEPNGPIPAVHTCKGRDLSPALVWKDVPKEADTLALILDDPDAPRGTWTHWTFWDLPATVTGLAEGEKATLRKATEGITSARTMGYHGPCPPSGTHRYVFTLYAVQGRLGLPSTATVEDLRRALQGRVVAQADVMGTFAKE
ncbi:MAG TPA: YbhB/YbcL family Raf kinase inhibitor-like protein [Candidatus Thermoplasmatota archaeon]|nr:YbhB/YbcL family Raf kinase inhibitor-like protein [Candidatus Thermoplasmatota archaeon]